VWGASLVKNSWKNLGKNLREVFGGFPRVRISFLMENVALAKALQLQEFFHEKHRSESFLLTNSHHLRYTRTLTVYNQYWHTLLNSFGYYF